MKPNKDKLLAQSSANHLKYDQYQNLEKVFSIKAFVK